MTLPSKNKNQISTYEYYNQKAKEFFENTVTLQMENIYQPFLELIPNGGKILDAGCGSGRDTLYFIKKGYNVVAFDYSEPLVQLACEYTGKEILLMSFDDIDFNEDFDGIWACASLIHISKKRINDIMILLNRSLKQNGIIYASFKYGDGEGLRKGRFFNDYNEKTLNSLIKDLPSLKIIKDWKTEDIRKDRKSEYWLNLLIQKR